MSVERSNGLHTLFHPRSIAVVGATPKKQYNWASGNNWISGSISQGFSGPIYPIHPTAKSIFGIRAYPSVLDVPDEIDLVIFTVPIPAVLQVMDQCIQKGVKFAHLLTAGFSETGRQDFADIERALVAKARAGGVRIVGPNCMGLYSPEGGLAWDPDFPTAPGPVGLFSQSGQLVSHIIRDGQGHGLRYSQAVSFGNASDIQAYEFLKYLAEDAKTEIIGAYIEGLRDGRSFFETAGKVTRHKPVVVWKGGQTEGGARATQSHTAAIAGSQKIWQALCRQAGIISVHSIEEFIFTISALRHLPLPQGVNAAVLGGAGGGSVTMTDVAEKEGLKVPHLTEGTIRQLEEFVPLEGSGLKNPLDIMPALDRKDSFMRVMTLLRDDPNIDALLYHSRVNWIYEDHGHAGLNEYLRNTLEARDILEKPMFVILPRQEDVSMEMVRQEAEQWYQEAGVATFPTFDLAARILFNLDRYRNFLSSRE